MTANYHKPPVPVFIFMGTSGCGKSSVAAACQKILGCEVLEGDELHPKANIDKMSKGKSRCWIAMDKGAGRSFVEEGEDNMRKLCGVLKTNAATTIVL